MGNRSAAFLILLFLFAVVAGSVFLDRPPAPVPATAPASQFSAERALVYLDHFAQKPHPIGTPEHDRVRDYLVSQIKLLGLEPEVQRAVGITPIYQVAGTVENIVVRLKGTNNSSDAAMLAAHYDSVAAGPGAGDDGSGVAALLESLRALRAGPRLKNDLIVLLSDGEEDGMLGASAFMAEHPWAKDVRVAANFEARGNAGISELFETSAGNGHLIRLFADAAPHPAGSSLTYEIYKHMPNDTDLTVFKHSGAAGLNFAFIGNWEAYHTPRDNPEQLDRGSLQQQGEYALSLARALGNADLERLHAADAVYFSLPGGIFLRYSSKAAWPLGIAALLALLAVCFQAIRRSQATFSGILLGVLANLATLIGLMLVSFVFVRGVRWLHPHLLREGNVTQSVPYMLSLIALLTGLGAVAYKLLRKKLSWPNLALGASAILFGFLLASAAWLPGGTYALMWPLLALVLTVFVRRSAGEAPSWSGTIALCLLMCVPLVLFVPMLRGFYVALGLTTIAAPLMALMLTLLLFSALPVFDLLLDAAANAIPFASFCAALALLLLGMWTTHYSAAHPKPSVIIYALDTAGGKALWASSAPTADSWAAQYVGTSPVQGGLTGFYPDWLPYRLLQHEAPVLLLPAPQAELLENFVAGGTRTLRLRIVSPRHARALSVEAPENEVIDGWLGERKLGQPSDSRWNKHGNWSLEYANAPADGIELRLRIKGTKQVKLVIVDRSIGLPEVPREVFVPRPAECVQQHGGDETMVRRVFVF